MSFRSGWFLFRSLRRSTSDVLALLALLIVGAWCGSR